MYPCYYPLPPPSSYYAILRAQKAAEAVDRENVILNRQICELTRQNIDLRTKIIKMNSEKYVNDRNDTNIGYSKEALKVKQEAREKKFNIEDRRYFNDTQRSGMDRAYSFGRLNKDNSEKKQKEFSSLQKDRKTVSEPNTGPKRTSEEQKNYTYLTLQEAKQLKQSEQRNTNTIIEGLNQFSKNQQNPQNIHKPFLRIESEAYNEPIPQTHQDRALKSEVKKDNKVYLQRDQEDRPTAYSPISKLKSIKKLNESQAPPEPTIQSRKTIGKKHYLSLIGSVFDKARNTENSGNLANSEQKDKYYQEALKQNQQ